MPRGPLPDPNARRRNAPTIPTTTLPAAGRTEPAPDPPSWVELASSGLAWWDWAWHTPQAAAWSDGDMSVVARRASLEDDLSIIERVDTIDFVLADVADAETQSQVRAIIGKLAALVSGRVSICREMRELDNLLGLTPKGMASLRWTIVGEKPQRVPAVVTDMEQERRARLMADGA